MSCFHRIKIGRRAFAKSAPINASSAKSLTLSILSIKSTCIRYFMMISMRGPIFCKPGNATPTMLARCCNVRRHYGWRAVLPGCRFKPANNWFVFVCVFLFVCVFGQCCWSVAVWVTLSVPWSVVLNHCAWVTTDKFKSIGWNLLCLAIMQIVWLK